MTWSQSIADEIADIFDGYSWHRDEIQIAYQIRAERLRARAREWAADYRAKMRLAAEWVDRRREYMRDYMREYAKTRYRDDADFRERRRKAAREGMRRLHERRRGQVVPLMRPGAKPIGISHRPHRCSLCKQPGHHRQSCGMKVAA